MIGSIGSFPGTIYNDSARQQSGKKQQVEIQRTMSCPAPAWRLARVSDRPWILFGCCQDHLVVLWLQGDKHRGATQLEGFVLELWVTSYYV